MNGNMLKDRTKNETIQAKLEIAPIGDKMSENV